MPQESPARISAEVILKSESGRSLAKGKASVTSANVGELRPAEGTVAEATRRLREMGFAVSPPGVTLSITGPQALFEQAFAAKLTLRKRESDGALLIQPDRELVVPASLQDLVEAVVFPEPPEFFP